jgi:hypothetical protein
MEHSNEEKTSQQCVRKGLIELSTIFNGSTPQRPNSSVLTVQQIIVFAQFSENEGSHLNSKFISFS